MGSLFIMTQSTFQQSTLMLRRKIWPFKTLGYLQITDFKDYV